MKRIVFLIIIILSGIFNVLTAQINVSIPDTAATMGDTLLVPVYVGDLSNDDIYSYQFKLYFDENVIKITGLETEGTISAQWDLISPLFSNAQDGVVEVGHFGVYHPLTGSGVLIYLRVEAIGVHLDSSRFQFENFIFNAGQPVAQTKDGKINIFAPIINVTFLTNVNDPVEIKVDNLLKHTPFDTSWYAGTEHSISIESPQYPSSDVKYIFQGWSDNGDTTHFVVPVSDTVFQCNLNTEFLLTIQSDYGTAIGQGWHKKDTLVTISIDSLVSEGDTTRYLFDSWQGTGENAYTGPERTVQLVMGGPVVEVAHWRTQYYLNIDSPFGDPQGEGWFDQGDTVLISIDSTFSEIENTRYVFDKWIGIGDGSYSGKDQKAQVIVNAPIHETAVWKKEFFLAIFSQPDTLFNFTQNGWYTENDTISSIFAPVEVTVNGLKYGFKNWTLDEQVNYDNPITLVMDTSHVLVANFSLDSVFVSIRTNLPQPVQIYIDSISFWTPYEKFWKYNSTHRVMVDSIVSAEDSLSRFRFVDWNDGGSRIHSITADTVLSVFVNFTTQYFLMVGTEPPGILEFFETGWYDNGDTVIISEAPLKIAIESDTLLFVTWKIDSLPVSENPIQVVMDEPHFAIAWYDYLYFISGFVRDSRNHSVENVTMILSRGANDTVYTTDEGFYIFTSLSEGNYQVTPSLDWARFEPGFKEYSLLQNSQENQNFVAIDIVAPEIAVISPNGGERIHCCTEDTLIWEANDNIGIDSIIVELSLDKGNNWEILNRMNDGDISSMIWNVPDTTSDLCLIKITVIDYDGNRSIDWSDSCFSIYKLTDVGINDEQILPQKFELFQNYPNPFNNYTIIPFQIPETSHVSVWIFNAMGQRIIQLIDKKMKPGYYQLRWDGKNDQGEIVSSGIYLYQINISSEKVKTRKMLFLK